jgi:hypothetical protein
MPWTLTELWDVEAATFSRQSSHRGRWCQRYLSVDRTSHPRKIPGPHFYQQRNQPQFHSLAGGVRRIQVNEHVRNRTCDLSASSVVPHALSYRASQSFFYIGLQGKAGDCLVKGKAEGNMLVHYTWRWVEGVRKTTHWVRIFGVAAEIRTENLQNLNQWCYRYAIYVGFEECRLQGCHAVWLL